MDNGPKPKQTPPMTGDRGEGIEMATEDIGALDYDTPEGMQFRVRRQIAVARGWQLRLLRALRGDEMADCHPDAARWQRNAYMARARRIRNEFLAGAR